MLNDLTVFSLNSLSLLTAFIVFLLPCPEYSLRLTGQLGCANAEVRLAPTLFTVAAR